MNPSAAECPNLFDQVPRDLVIEFAHAGEFAHQGGLVGRRFEVPKQLLLVQVDGADINRSAGKIHHRGLLSLNELVDLLDGSRVCHAGGRADARPKEPNDEIALRNNLLVERLLGPHPGGRC